MRESACLILSLNSRGSINDDACFTSRVSDAPVYHNNTTQDKVYSLHVLGSQSSLIPHSSLATSPLDITAYSPQKLRSDLTIPRL